MCPRTTGSYPSKAQERQKTHGPWHNKQLGACSSLYLLLHFRNKNLCLKLMHLTWKSFGVLAFTPAIGSEVVTSSSFPSFCQGEKIRSTWWHKTKAKNICINKRTATYCLKFFLSWCSQIQFFNNFQCWGNIFCVKYWADFCQHRSRHTWKHSRLYS